MPFILFTLESRRNKWSEGAWSNRAQVRSVEFPSSKNMEYLERSRRLTKDIVVFITGGWMARCSCRLRLHSSVLSLDSSHETVSLSSISNLPFLLHSSSLHFASTSEIPQVTSILESFHSCNASLRPSFPSVAFHVSSTH